MSRTGNIVSFSELQRRARAEHDRRRQRNQFDGDGLTLTGGGCDYFIARDRIDTPLKVLHWLAHLSNKTWFTLEDAQDVMTYAQRHNDVDPYAERI